ncbi:hypothetical protein FB461_2100 [Rarobacter faecitabidus]|uniref:Uncharacterized protein n=1 Tax=Rarobacter faecitabidus TaxID=13243 RepID=A0A542ZAK1_RARFA|nr:hypothetical protein FB461_2100 [Rarobacter faecitabidus]
MTAPTATAIAMSQDIPDARTHETWVRAFVILLRVWVVLSRVSVLGPVVGAAFMPVV